MEKTDKQILEDICNDLGSGKWSKHWEEGRFIIRPSGNPLTKNENEAMLQNEDVIIDKQVLISINSLEIFSEIAVACLTVHQVFSYKGTPNNDISVMLIVFKKSNEGWKMIHGSRSQGRDPNNSKMPVFPEILLNNSNKKNKTVILSPTEQQLHGAGMIGGGRFAPP